MSDVYGQHVGDRALSRREALVAACGGVGVAGLAVLGRPALGFGRVLDDPVAGLRAPASLRSSSLGAAFTTTAAARRGVPGFRPKRPLRPGTLMGAISIPSIGLADDLREGIDLFVLDQGPGHWAGSATPGEVGNCIIAGHRVSHTHPFYDIDAVPVGAEMVLSRAGIDHVYVATARQVVSPTATDILDPTTERTATIFACHPRGSIAQRFVVQFTHAN